MDEAFFILSVEEQENLQRAIETSLRVRRRHQFFLWTQGPLQAFIPHNILICALAREGKEVLVMDRFNTCVVSEQTFEEVCHPGKGLVMQAMSAWREAGDSPLPMATGVQGPAIHARFAHQLDGFISAALPGMSVRLIDGYSGAACSI